MQSNSGNMAYEPIALDKFVGVFGNSTELSSVALGGQVLSVSDDFFASAHNLLLVEPAPSLKGQFGPNGALFSGWESRRHNSTYDWCIIKLGTTGMLAGFDIDTAHFNGNEAPEASVEMIEGSSTDIPTVNDPRWTEILPKVKLGPSSRHLFKIPETFRANFVKLKMHPDGGIARFRAYGNVAPVYPDDPRATFDLAHVFAGGRVEFTSDQHFGAGSNLILPGRGKDMGDGWETRRSRQTSHKDWAIIKLGTPGILEYVEIDTAHFKGNFPESCSVHALYVDGAADWGKTRGETEDWKLVMPRTKLGPHRQHYIHLENVDGEVFTHVKVTIYPDGGIKRVRVLGHRPCVDALKSPITEDSLRNIPGAPRVSAPEKIIPVLPLTPEAFASFGRVIQAYADHTAAPKGTHITPANAGTAGKFHKLAVPVEAYSAGAGATLGISVCRCNPVHVPGDCIMPVTVLERHPFTTQAFIPMGKGAGEGLQNPGCAFLVVVAENGVDDKPDMASVRAFLASSAQGIMYNIAVWRKSIDFSPSYLVLKVWMF
ncbi:Allantoicase [Fistulina hepatica ATCC 64428]|uniref:Allantoicase n=1 Tax=Fistulina hepatica ATCC 64428 TaxID=1128425 RepID=A0A0D7A286_9AGAR|nr:Allantoicase [Fistulina hepatica ATCC 64428]